MKNKLSIIVSALLLSGSVYAKDMNIVNGWQMKGFDSGFSTMDVFNKSCIDTIWSYDTSTKKWKVYSYSNIIQGLIEKDNSIMSLSNLKENEGFWINANSDCVIEGNNTITNTQDTTLQDGLVAHYEFEGNANDSSGNGNDGTEYGGVSYVDGVIGKAGSFDDTYILVDNSDSLKFVDSFSVSFWFNTQSNMGMNGYGSEIAYGRQTIIAKSGDRKGFTIKTSVKEASNLQYPYIFNGKCCSDYGYSLALNYDEKSKEYISNGLLMNEWHIMSYIYENNIMRVYVDGILENTSEENKFYINEINTERLQIGIGQSASWYPYHGLVDDLRIYDRALSESEIEELYNLGK